MSDTEIVKQAVTFADPLRFDLPANALPERLDKVLARLMPDHSRSRLQAWIEGGHVLLNGKVARIRSPAGPGSQILVWPQQAPEDLAFAPEPVDFELVAESTDWLLLNKPAGLVTHPGAGNWHGTLLNGLLYRYPELSRLARAGIVHRLDKDTSGLMVVARTETARTNLVRQLQERTVLREYHALVHGVLNGAGVADAAIGRDPAVPVRMSANRPVAPRQALTHYLALADGELESRPVTLVLCRLETGRTHQIRVHMAYLQHPLLGDVLYGGRLLPGVERHMLHAHTLAFNDPANGSLRSFSVPPPADFAAIREAVQWKHSPAS